MRRFMVTSAVLAWTFGAALLFVPADFLAPMGITVTPAIAVSAQAQGAILIGLGAINFGARAMTADTAGPILFGNLIVQALSLLVIGRALVTRAVPVQNAPAVLVHVLLGAGFLYHIMQRSGTRGRRAKNAGQAKRDVAR